MGTALAILGGGLLAGSAYASVEGVRAQKDAAKQQSAMLDRQMKEQKAQQAKEKKQVAARKALEKRKDVAGGELEAGKQRQRSKRASTGRQGTILTDGAGAAPGGGMLGGAGAQASGGQKNLLGL